MKLRSTMVVKNLTRDILVDPLPLCHLVTLSPVFSLFSFYDLTAGLCSAIYPVMALKPFPSSIG